MFEKLSTVEERYEDISTRLSDPAVISDNEKYRTLMKEYKNLTPIVEKYREYKKARDAHEEAAELLEEGGLDRDFREIVEEQYRESQEEIDRTGEELKILLLPKDPNDDKNVIMEIRGGARRRGGSAVCPFADADVHHVCRAQPLEGGGTQPQRYRTGRRQGGQLLHHRRGRLFPPEV